MIITLTRSGGFTGIPLKKTIDTSTLPKEKAKQLEERIKKYESGIMQRDEGSTRPLQQADRFAYTISLQHEGIMQTHTLEESMINDEERLLINTLLASSS